MKIISETTNIQLENDSAIAIGKFDGLHLGHRKLLSELKTRAKTGGRDLDTVVFTFEPSAAVFFGKGDIKELSTKCEKHKLFEDMGIDILIEYPLNNETAHIEAEDFIKEVLAKQLRCKMICAGEDLSFGYMGKGDFALMDSLKSEYGYETCVIDKALYLDEEISSTRIRTAVANGEMGKVCDMLGAPYSIEGEILEGRHIGRTIGFPTINICAEKEKLMPPFGVYKSRVILGVKRDCDDKLCTHTSSELEVYRGITNIGVNPTVADGNAVSIETHIYDFKADLYGKYVKVELLDFKRPERKFSGISELKEQIARDIEDCR